MKTIAILTAKLLATMSLAVVLPTTSDAQTQCAEGRTAAGQCTDAATAEAARQRAVITSQSKLSTTAYPVMPSADGRYRYPNELNPSQLQPSPRGTPAPN